MALHVDEETPHVHVRRVWMVEDEHGNEYVSETKALEELGEPLLDSHRPQSKINNPKITMTQTDIELFRDICRERGIDVEIGKDKKEHLSTLDYKLMKRQEEIEAANRELQRLQNEINLMQLEASADEKKRTEAYKRRLSQKEAQIEEMKSYMRENGLYEEYQKSRAEKLPNEKHR